MNDLGEELPAQKWPPLTVAQAHAISAMTDPALRNLRITQGYHGLKIALTRLFGARNVTWCAYATWASKTAGTFIRGEEVPGLIRAYLAASDHLAEVIAHANGRLLGVHEHARLDHGFVNETIEEVIRDVTGQVGQGNLIVFQELAPLYAAWLEAFPSRPARFDAGAIDAFVADNLTPGPVEAGGQDLLIQAFRAYYDAMLERDAGRKAQLMFLANALVGYHEQTRLQGPIVGALDAPLVDIFVGKAHGHAKRALPAILHAAIEAVLDEVLRPIGKRLEAEWQAVSTRWLMSLALPDVVLHLGKDVVPVSPTRMFPEELATATLEPLVAILARLDRTPDTLRGSAARNWGDLGDRMNFVVDFFRTRQQDAALYRPPFSDEQVAAFTAGTLPAGTL
jgi:hypothetical protein